MSELTKTTVGLSKKANAYINYYHGRLKSLGHALRKDQVVNRAIEEAADLDPEFTEFFSSNVMQHNATKL